MRQCLAALVSAIVCLIGLMMVTSGIGVANDVLEGPTSAMGWVAEAIWAIVFLAIVGSLIFVFDQRSTCDLAIKIKGFTSMRCCHFSAVGISSGL